jgi:MinD superfamily P-loop ATPase
MIISIASGKGGTGKTTVAANLAVSLNKPVQLLDCDVEEPNLHLFIGPEKSDTETITTLVPEILDDKCTLCGQCEALCQFKAIAIIAGTAAMTFPELCHSCGGCFEVCPENAIHKSYRELGTITRGYHQDIGLVYGRLRVGEAMAPPLIKKVKSRAPLDSITIIDSPPGTSCPVIAAMRDTDFVILVTEPTPFGLNDLKLAVGAVQMLHIPFGLVINRSDIGNQDVKNYAESIGMPVLMEIPFDRQIAEATTAGKLMVRELPGYREKFLNIFEQINNIV